MDRVVREFPRFRLSQTFMIGTTAVQMNYQKCIIFPLIRMESVRFGKFSILFRRSEIPLVPSGSLQHDFFSIKRRNWWNSPGHLRGEFPRRFIRNFSRRPSVIRTFCRVTSICFQMRETNDVLQLSVFGHDFSGKLSCFSRWMFSPYSEWAFPTSSEPIFPVDFSENRKCLFSC